MTLDDIQERLNRIASILSDDEAHMWEDSLHQDVLKAIAEGQCDDPAACARLALTSQQMVFSRWCA